MIEADIEESKIYGTGNHFAPRIMLPMNINIAHGYMQQDEGIVLRRIHVKLCPTPHYAIAETSAEVNQLITKQYNTMKTTVHLDFLVDNSRIAALEKLRNGGDLKLRVEASLITDRLRSLNPPNPQAIPSSWAYCDRSDLRLSEELIIPRDTWISRVLPQLGYGVVHVLEFPAAPLEACQQLKSSFDAMVQAQERHRIGMYDDAVGKCRVALDPFFEMIEKPDDKGVVRRVPKLKRSWESKLGEATYGWLNGVFGAIREAGNPNHHTPSAHYDQVESQMILVTTAAVLAFVARTLGKESL